MNYVNMLNKSNTLNTYIKGKYEHFEYIYCQRHVDNI